VVISGKVFAPKENQMTRLRTPRISPLPPEEWDDDTRQLLASLQREGRIFNIFATLARHPALLRRWLVFGTHILGKSTLPPRERELAILRMGWLCRADYEWGHHVTMGKEAGLTDLEIKRVAQGPEAAGWESFERTLLRAVDELHHDTFISDAVWQSLAARYNTPQLLDLVFTAGQYKLVCMALNSIGVQLEPGYEGLP
jgi:alkylhydroperoxidase family enzyme